MEASGDALFPRRYLDEHEKQIAELHEYVELARVHAAHTMLGTVALLLDAAEAHEQAAAACELAGSNGHARDFQARAGRHLQAAADRRAAAAALASRIQARRDSDAIGPQAAISEGQPLTLPGPRQADESHIWASCGKCPRQQRDPELYELALDDDELRAIGPWQPVLPARRPAALALAGKPRVTVRGDARRRAEVNHGAAV